MISALQKLLRRLSPIDNRSLSTDDRLVLRAVRLAALELAGDAGAIVADAEAIDALARLQYGRSTAWTNALQDMHLSGQFFGAVPSLRDRGLLAVCGRSRNGYCLTAEGLRHTLDLLLEEGIHGRG